MAYEVYTYYIISGSTLCLWQWKRGKNNEPYDGGHGIGIDTATINQLDLIEDSVSP